MGIGDKLVALAPHDRADLGMGLVMHEAIDDVRARPFQPPRLADIGGLVKAGFQLDQCGDGFAGFRGFAEGADDRAVMAGAIQGLLDRQYVRIARRLFQKADHHVERLIGVMQQHILLADRGEHIALMVLHPFGDARIEGGPQQILAAAQDQFLEVRHADHPTDRDHIGIGHMEFLHDQGLQLRWCGGGDLEPDHLSPPAALQGGFKLAHQIFGLVLYLQIAVAQHAEGAMAAIRIAGEEHAQMQKQQLFQRQKAMLPRLRGQGHESRDLLGDGQQRLQAALVAAAFQFQRKAKAGVGDEGKGMRRVNRQGRQHREDIGHEMLFKELQVARRQLGAGDKGNPLLFHLALELVENALLGVQQMTRIFVNQAQLL